MKNGITSPGDGIISPGHQQVGFVKVHHQHTGVSQRLHAAQQMHFGVSDAALVQYAAIAGRPFTGQHGLFDLATPYFASKILLDQLTAPVGNATTRLIARTLDLMNRGEWEELVAMQLAADDVVRFDRRRTVSAPTVSDSESFGANAAGGCVW